MSESKGKREIGGGGKREMEMLRGMKKGQH